MVLLSVLPLGFLCELFVSCVVKSNGFIPVYVVICVQECLVRAPHQPDFGGSLYIELTKSVDMLQKLPYHTILCIW